MRRIVTAWSVIVTLVWGGAAGAQVAAKTFPPPARTGWVPSGERAVDAEVPVLPKRNAWRNLHGDALNTDELTGAIGPVLREDWTAETDTYNVTGPVFDSDGNLYFAPLWPFENVVLISLEPGSGTRRWAIPGPTAPVVGAPPGGSAPLILADPDDPGEEIVYLALYDRIFAVRTDGTILWDVPTGLTLGSVPQGNLVLGTNYLPAHDAIVGISNDGFIFVHDRRSGAPRLAAPFELPGSPSPVPPSPIPPPLWAAADVLFRTMVDALPGSFFVFTQGLLGNGSEVSNMLGIDPATGRLFVASTAPDAEDGTVDGISELGALYGLDVVPSGPDLAVVESCRRNFVGGSASTPSLRADGSKIYLGDNDGRLIALDSDCSDLWEVDLGDQIVGSVAVSSDNDVVYAATRQGIFEVLDNGASGSIGWTALLDVFDVPPGLSNANLNLVSIGANGLSFQAGAGFITANDVLLPEAVGVGVMDRASGEVRSFVEGGEETVAVMSTAADGGLYIGSSPVRRIFTLVLDPSAPPLVGGITRFAVDRHDLLVRDAACAAADRDRRAEEIHPVQPAGSAADAEQGQDLVAQARAALVDAVSRDQVDSGLAGTLDALLVSADAHHAAYLTGGVASELAAAASDLDQVCSAVDLATPLGAQRLQLVDKPGRPEARRLVLVSRDPALAAPDASAGPDVAGVQVQLENPTTGESATIELPASNWSSTQSGYAYRDNARADGPCKRATLRPGRTFSLNCRGSGVGFTLDETSQGSLDVRLQLGTAAPQCMHFGGDVRRDFGMAGTRAGSFLATRAPAPTGCPLP